MRNLITRLSSTVRKIPLKKGLTIIRKKPITSFIIALAVLTVLILLSNFVFAPKQEEIKKEPQIKEVQTFNIGTTSRISVQAQVEKAGVVKISALMGGVVQSINVWEGEYVFKGTNLVQLVSNYQGGNAAALQSAIAAKQYQQASDTYPTQKDIINKQRDVANKSETNFEELRTITGESLNETQSLIDLDQSILNSLNNQLIGLDPNSSAAIQIKSQQAQLQAGLNQLKAAQRSTSYQAGTDNPPTDLAVLQRDITLKQLDVQEKSLQIGKEISQLQLALAGVNEGLMHPVAPFNGTIQRVYVKVGQAVNPGTPLFTFVGDTQKTTIVAKVPLKTAQTVSMYEPSTIHLNGQTVELLPANISTEATDGSLYSVVYELPEEFTGKVGDGSFVTVDIPLGVPDTGSTVPFVPLDAIFQTQTEALVYVVKDGKAMSRKIQLGNVVGSFAAVLDGLHSGDEIILNRTVIEGDPVKVVNIK